MMLQRLAQRCPLIIVLGLYSACLLADSDPRTEGVQAALLTFLDQVDQRSAHQRFWSDELIYTSSSGERFGKATILSGFEPSEAAAPAATTQYSARDIVIRFEQDLALLTFTLLAETTDQTGTEGQFYLNSGVLINAASPDQPEHWQVVQWQATRVPDLPSVDDH
ncbi:MAG: DUF4440 domain-containing protein [Pseudomonadota bacterium]